MQTNVERFKYVSQSEHFKLHQNRSNVTTAPEPMIFTEPIKYVLRFCQQLRRNNAKETVNVPKRR